MYLQTMQKIAEMVGNVQKRSVKTQEEFDKLISELPPHIIGFERKFLINMIEIMCSEDYPDSPEFPFPPTMKIDDMCSTDYLRLGRFLRKCSLLEERNHKYLINEPMRVLVNQRTHNPVSFEGSYKLRTECMV
jgi:hypothetical protein